MSSQIWHLDCTPRRLHSCRTSCRFVDTRPFVSSSCPTYFEYANGHCGWITLSHQCCVVHGLVICIASDNWTIVTMMERKINNVIVVIVWFFVSVGVVSSLGVVLLLCDSSRAASNGANVQWNIDKYKYFLVLERKVESSIFWGRWIHVGESHLVNNALCIIEHHTLKSKMMVCTSSLTRLLPFLFTFQGQPRPHFSFSSWLRQSSLLLLMDDVTRNFSSLLPLYLSPQLLLAYSYEASCYDKCRQSHSWSESTHWWWISNYQMARICGCL